MAEACLIPRVGPEKKNSKLFLQNNMIVFGKVRLSQYRKKKNSFFGFTALKTGGD